MCPGVGQGYYPSRRRHHVLSQGRVGQDECPRGGSNSSKKGRAAVHAAKIFAGGRTSFLPPDIHEAATYDSAKAKRSGLLLNVYNFKAVLEFLAGKYKVSAANTPASAPASAAAFLEADVEEGAASGTGAFLEANQRAAMDSPPSRGRRSDGISPRRFGRDEVEEGLEGVEEGLEAMDSIWDD